MREKRIHSVKTTEYLAFAKAMNRFYSVWWGKHWTVRWKDPAPRIYHSVHWTVNGVAGPRIDTRDLLPNMILPCHRRYQREAFQTAMPCVWRIATPRVNGFKFGYMIKSSPGPSVTVTRAMAVSPFAMPASGMRAVTWDIIVTVTLSFVNVSLILVGRLSWRFLWLLSLTSSCTRDERKVRPVPVSNGWMRRLYESTEFFKKLQTKIKKVCPPNVPYFAYQRLVCTVQ